MLNFSLVSSLRECAVQNSVQKSNSILMKLESEFGIMMLFILCSIIACADRFVLESYIQFQSCNVGIVSYSIIARACCLDQKMVILNVNL